jgi:hypothetical protein
VTQISRPLQIALAAVVLLAAVWFFALRGHSSPSDSSSAGASSSPTTAPAPASSRSSSTATSSNTSGGHGRAGRTANKATTSNVAGLTRAIDRARRVLDKSGGSGAHVATPSAVGAVSNQAAVEGELKGGQTVIVLFWNPSGSVDSVVRRQLQALQGVLRQLPSAQDKHVAVHYSLANEVGSYGAITRSLQVLQTPTLLVIGPSGKTKTLTGLVDAYAIAQAIVEARSS